MKWINSRIKTRRLRLRNEEDQTSDVGVKIMRGREEAIDETEKVESAKIKVVSAYLSCGGILRDCHLQFC